MSDEEKWRLANRPASTTWTVHRLTSTQVRISNEMFREMQEMLDEQLGRMFSVEIIWDGRPPHLQESYHDEDR